MGVLQGVASLCGRVVLFWTNGRRPRNSKIYTTSHLPLTVGKLALRLADEHYMHTCNASDGKGTTTQQHHPPNWAKATKDCEKTCCLSRLAGELKKGHKDVLKERTENERFLLGAHVGPLFATVSTLSSWSSCMQCIRAQAQLPLSIPPILSTTSVL